MAPRQTHKRIWDEVDGYIAESLIPPDAVMNAVREAIRAAGLPAIDVTPSQGKFLHLLALIRGARKILEIGTLGGYSTIWLARALPREGRLITLEIDPKHAEVAQANLNRTGVDKKVEIRVGPAETSLKKLHRETAGPFDLIFVDADKENNPVYLKWALKLAKRGTVIVVDNVVRDGAIADAASQDPAIVRTREMFAMMAKEPRLSATAMQTVGSKGYDGFAMAVVVSD